MKPSLAPLPGILGKAWKFNRTEKVWTGSQQVREGRKPLVWPSLVPFGPVKPSLACSVLHWEVVVGMFHCGAERLKQNQKRVR